jgi:hypothetical protein
MFGFFLDTIKPWFLTEGKLAAVLIKPSSWGSQMDGDLHYHTPPQQDCTTKVDYLDRMSAPLRYG